MFAIITSELDGPTEHYVGEDDALWDWLQADNLEPVSGVSLYRLQAPAGYVFYHGDLFPAGDSTGYDGGGRDSDFVSLGFGKEAKALMLLFSLRSVTPEALTEMGVDENRTLEVETYKNC
jgi:hypothetical protein